MRDIKFRAKSKRCFPQRWIYGDLLQPTTLLQDNYEISDCNSVDGSRYDIEPETIGQYTGLKDKNGIEIYEGDIVKIDCPTMKMQGKVFYCENGADFRIYDEIEDIEETLWYQQEEYEVVGNIYDNPELLGEQTNE